MHRTEAMLVFTSWGTGFFISLLLDWSRIDSTGGVLCYATMLRFASLPVKFSFHHHFILLYVSNISHVQLYSRPMYHVSYTFRDWCIEIGQVRCSCVIMPCVIIKYYFMKLLFSWIFHQLCCCGGICNIVLIWIILIIHHPYHHPYFHPYIIIQIQLMS